MSTPNFFMACLWMRAYDHTLTLYPHSRGPLYTSRTSLRYWSRVSFLRRPVDLRRGMAAEPLLRMSAIQRLAFSYSVQAASAASATVLPDL